MALGYLLQVAEDVATANAPIAYYQDDGSLTADATTGATGLQSAATYLDGTVDENTLMQVLGNAQIRHSDKYISIKRCDVQVTLV